MYFSQKMGGDSNQKIPSTYNPNYNVSQPATAGLQKAVNDFSGVHFYILGRRISLLVIILP